MSAHGDAGRGQRARRILAGATRDVSGPMLLLSRLVDQVLTHPALDVDTAASLLGGEPLRPPEPHSKLSPNAGCCVRPTCPTTGEPGPNLSTGGSRVRFLTWWGLMFGAPVRQWVGSRGWVVLRGKLAEELSSGLASTTRAWTGGLARTSSLSSLRTTTSVATANVRERVIFFAEGAATGVAASPGAGVVAGREARDLRALDPASVPAFAPVDIDIGEMLRSGAATRSPTRRTPSGTRTRCASPTARSRATIGRLRRPAVRGVRRRLGSRSRAVGPGGVGGAVRRDRRALRRARDQAHGRLLPVAHRRREPAPAGLELPPGRRR